MNKYYRIDLIENFIYDNNLNIVKFCNMCKISTKTYYKLKKQQDCRVSVMFKISKIINLPMCVLYY